MIDLTKRDLPNVVLIDGSPFFINTDFRLWMRFEIEVTRLKQGQALDVSYLFKDSMPEHCSLNDLFVFSRPKSELPRGTGHSGVVVLDYQIDADLIYAAFMGQYGIDLFEVETLHWHKFLALLKGLNDSTKLREVMGYRCYEKSDGKKDIYEQLRRAWEIECLTEEEQAGLDEFSRVFSSEGT